MMDECKLKEQIITDLISDLQEMKRGMVDKEHYEDASVMEKSSNLLRDLHIINTECLREIRAIKQSLKHHFAGLAMQGLIADSGGQYKDSEVVINAYAIADAMVKYGEEESKVKRTKDGVGGASTDYKDS
jgi:hypothetical protein